MRTFRFVIPIKLEDLLHSSGHLDVYSVQFEYNSREIPHKLNDCSDNFRNNGLKSIFEDFDVYYSCLKNFNSLEVKHKDQCWKLIHKSLNKLYNDLEIYFNDFDANERNDYLNLCKMIVYVFCSLSELFEEQDIKQSTTSDFTADIGPKKANKKNKRTEESYDWQQNKDKGMSVLLRLLSLPLHRLFSPPVIEDEFINIILKCCYKMLENPLLSRQKDSSLALNIFHIIGSAVEKHRQSLSFCLKLIQLLQMKEALVPILANLVEAIVKKHNQKLLISEIIREIKRIDIRELSRDSSGPKAISTFLVEVTEKCPQEMISSISDLLDFLEEDSYLMRNATLSIIGILVVKELSKDNSKEKRNLRDQLLDKLEDHIHDITSYTRSRALQVWCSLCQAEVIPLPRLETLIEAIVGRLRDKSCFVRKYAVQFLNEFLTRNPFAAKLSIDVLKTCYKEEEEKLKALIAMSEQNEKEVDKNNVENVDDLAKSWNIIEPELLKFWFEIATSSVDSCDNVDDEIQNQTILSNCEEVDDAFTRFRCLLLEKKFKSALSLLKKLKDQFPDNRTIHPNDDEMSVEDSSSENGSDDENNKGDETVLEENTDKPPLPDTIALAKRIFFDNSKNTEKSSLDLGSKTVERDIEKLVTNMVRSSQDTSQIPPQPTTEFEVVRPGLDVNESIDNVISRQQILVKYLSDCVKFTQQIQIAMPLVSDLLLSRNITDVQEAIEFFVSAYKFGVEGAIIGVRKLILLIWSQEKTIKDAAVSAYKKLYLNIDSEQRVNDSDKRDRQMALSVIKSLSELVMGATLGELISIEQLLKELMASEDITNVHVKVLWERFAMKLSNTTEDDSRAAIQLLGMLANSNPEIIRSEQNLSAIIDTALGERGLKDSRLVTETCIALGKAYRLPKTEKYEMFFRLPKNHILFNKLGSLLIQGLDKIDDKYYNMMSDNIVKVIFQLAENPDSICEQLVRQMLQKLLSLTQTEEITNGFQTISLDQQNKENIENNASSQASSQASTETDTQSMASSQATNDQLLTQMVRSARLINSEVLARFISLAGNIALNELIHIDLNILTELKIRNLIKEEKDKKRDKTPRRRSRTPGKTPGTVSGDQNLEEEIGLAGANAMEDQEQEYLINICNNDLVLGNNLLARISELIVCIAQDPVMYSDIRLRTSASLALAKYMSLSEPFCRLHLRLLATIMDKSEEAIIRANTIIAMGDLCVRFPNLLDQWTPKMFDRLRDPDVTVKMNALKVLSRLILSDMVKVKGQISEIAVLMVDQNEMLSSSSRLFFTELGKKQNAIYNVLPDIISHLSDTEIGLEEEDFRTVMKFIFELIEKNRQTVCLVEKLCQRFRSTTDERQWRDLAYCLSLLNYSDRSFQKLNECLICFADKLFCDFVHECIQTIIANARKIPQIRNETKQMIDEFEQKVNECRNKGTNEDDSEFQKVVGTPPASAAKRGSRLASTSKRAIASSSKKNKANKPVKSKRKVPTKGSEEEDTDEEITSNKRAAAPPSERRNDRPQRNIKKLQAIISSDEESS